MNSTAPSIPRQTAEKFTAPPPACDFARSTKWQNYWRARLSTPWSFRSRWPVVLPILLLAVVTLLFRYTNLDLTISSWFYHAESGQWPWFFSAPCTAFYRLGIYPPFVLVTLGGIWLTTGWILDGTGSLPRAGLFLVLLMVIGPGLIVNVGLKGHWGRARPHQVQQFGGQFEYSPVGSPGPLLHGNSSFPSGHAAIAFYLMAPAFLVSPRRQKLALGLLFAGIVYGLCMSATRVVQGGHFVSDVLWAGGIMYFLGVILARLILRSRAPERGECAP